VIHVQIPVRWRVVRCREHFEMRPHWLVYKNGALWMVHPTWIEAMEATR
jgi:hypothetical protein